METRRYETLDALRGVAAFAVMVYHLNSIRLEPEWVPHGYLAVDFFFVLSGFVVAFAYEGARQTWMTLPAFLVKRIIRLYPLAVLGAALGLVLLLLKWRLYPEKVDPLPQILVSGAFNLLLLPSLFGGAVSHKEIFPGNGPLWTLFFEGVVNVLWAWIGVRMRNAGLLGVAAVAWLVMAVYACRAHTLNVGFDIPTLAAGMARVCFGFPLGVVIYRLRSSLRVPRWPGGALSLAVLLVLVLASPLNAEEDGVPWWDLLSVLALLPTVVVLGTGQGSPGRSGTVLGALSYPVYVLHFPVLVVVSGLHQTLLRDWSVHLLVVAGIAVVCGLALAALRLYDEPLRRSLSRATGRGRAPRPLAAAIVPDA